MMKSFRLVLLVLAASGIGCSSGTTDTLNPNNKIHAGGGFAAGANGDISTGGGIGVAGHPAQQPSGQNLVVTDAVVQTVQQQVGSPVAEARLHGCSKIQYNTLGNLLSSRGVNIGSQGGQNNNGQSAGSIYSGGTSALGVANYGARVPESVFASTSTVTKQYDIFVAAAPEVIQNFGSSKDCTGATLMQNNQLTKDGISCLIGKPARDEHVQLANQIISSAANPADGQQLAIAALLEAAHTCE